MLATARFALAACLLALLASPSLAAPKVVATIKPIHSIAANVMAGVGEPHLLLDAAVSEHTAQLTPSQVAAMQNADLIVGGGRESRSLPAQGARKSRNLPAKAVRGRPIAGP